MIPSLDCTSVFCLVHNAYKSGSSSTYKKNGSDFAIHYRSGSASGFISNDVLQIGDLNIKNQDFGEVTEASGKALDYGRFDGILGLGLNPASVNHIVPPFYNMIDQRLLDEPIFAFSFVSRDHGSVVTFGGIDEKYYTGELIKIPLRNEFNWEVDSDLMAYGGETAELENNGVILDPSTSTIILPANLEELLNAEIGGRRGADGSYIVDCHKRQTAADLTFHLHGHSFTISASDYILHYGSDCISGIIGLDIFGPVGESLIILGDAFLRRYYSVFDLGNKAVWLANAA